MISEKPTTLISYVSAGLVLAAFGVGLFFQGYNDIHYAPAICALLLCALTAIIPCVGKGEITLPTGMAAVMLAVFWLYATISLSWSHVPFASLVTWLILSALPLTFVSLLIHVDRDAIIRASVIILTCAIGMLALWSVGERIFAGVARAHGPLINPNNLAALFNLALLPVLGLAVSTRPAGTARIALYALSVVLFAGLLATGSRAGFACFAVGAAFMAFTSGRETGRGKKWLLALGILAIAFIAMELTGGSTIGGRLATLAAPLSDSSMMQRFSLWDSATMMIQDHPFSGTGLGTFYLYYPAYRLPGDQLSAGYFAHMDPLQFGAEMGLAAMVLFYAALLAFAARILTSLARVDDARRPLIVGLSAALLALILHTHLCFHLYVMPILVVTGAWLAALYALTSLTPSSFTTVPVEGSKKWLAYGTVLSVAIIVGMMVASAASGQYYLNKAAAGIAHGDSGVFTENLEKASRWSPRSFVEPQVRMAGMYIDLLEGGGLFSVEEQRALFAEVTDLLDQAQAMNPAWGDIDHKRALLFARVDPAVAPDGTAKAAAAWEEALRKNPMHFRAQEEFASLLIKAGQPDRAYKILEKGLTYPHPPAVGASHQAFMKKIGELARMQSTYKNQFGGTGE